MLFMVPRQKHATFGLALAWKLFSLACSLSLLVSGVIDFLLSSTGLMPSCQLIAERFEAFEERKRQPRTIYFRNDWLSAFDRMPLPSLGSSSCGQAG